MIDVAKLNVVKADIPRVMFLSGLTDAIAKNSKASVDSEELRSWYASSKLPFSYGVDLNALLNECHSTVANLVKSFEVSMIDLSQPGLWVALRQLLVCMVILAEYPSHTLKGCPSVPSLLTDVAIILDTVSRLADGVEFKWIIPRTKEEAAMNRAHIVYDIVCGRSAAWVRYLCAYGIAVCGYIGADYFGMVAGLGNQFMNNVTSNILQSQKGTSKTASEDLVNLCLMILERFDKHQLSLWEQSLQPGDLVSYCERERYLRPYRDFYDMALPENGCRGWCKSFRVNAIACLFMLPHELEQKFLKALRVKHDKKLLDMLGDFV